MAVGTVGIGDDGEIGVAERGELARCRDIVAGEPRRARMLVISRRQNGGAAGTHEAGDQRQQDLRAGRRHHTIR